MTGRAARQSGFTVVELLTVLVLIGLLGVVLLAGFERVLDIRLRLAAFLDGVDAPVLVGDWFRATVGGLVADTADGPNRFAGGPRRFTGLTLAPLNAAAGVPARITWELVFSSQSGRTALRYRNNDEPPMTIASWPGAVGGLRYCDAELRCRDTWPPDPKSPQLPQLVELEAVKGSERWPILAAPAADRAAPPGHSRQP